MLCAVGSVGFHAGRHMWKAQVFGNVLQCFTFGIRSRVTDGTPGQQGNWWVWNFQQVYKVVNQNSSQAIARTESTITDCVSGDIIEFYLDCENGTLVMHNPRMPNGGKPWMELREMWFRYFAPLQRVIKFL